MSNQKLINAKEYTEAVKLLGDNYILYIIGSLGERDMRFNELQRNVPDICPATLTDRLKKLEQEKVIIRKSEPHDKISGGYELTEKGRGILPVIKAIGVFAEKHL